MIILIFSFTAPACKSHKEIASSDNTSDNDHNYGSKKIKSKYAVLLGVNEDKITNVKLYTFIDDWYGTPYKYGGSTKKGIDCSNFTSTLYREAFNRTLTGTSSSIYNQCKAISVSNLEEGDLVFFKIEKDEVSHIGVYLQNNKFVHATTKKGVMIDDLDEAYYKKYFYKAGRVHQ